LFAVYRLIALPGLVQPPPLSQNWERACPERGRRRSGVRAATANGRHASAAGCRSNETGGLCMRSARSLLRAFVILRSRETKNTRDLNSPNELRHAQPTRKFVLKPPVFDAKQTSRPDRPWQSPIRSFNLQLRLLGVGAGLRTVSPFAMMLTAKHHGYGSAPRSRTSALALIWVLWR